MNISEINKPIVNFVNHFDHVIEYMIVNLPKISSTTFNMGKKDLVLLNEILNFSENNAKQTSSQDMVPVIEFILLIAKEGGLLRREYHKSKLVYVPTPLYNQFHGFNTYEKYVYISWIFFSRIITDSSLCNGLLCWECETIIMEIAMNKTECLDNIIRVQNIIGVSKKHNILFYWLGYLGFYDLVIEDGKMKSVKITEFGYKFSKLIDDHDFLYITKYEDEEDNEYDYICSMKEMFPEGVILRMITIEPIVLGGTYSFKTSLSNRVWRRMVLSAHHTWEDLHLCIQDAFAFDNDHMYEFYLDGTLRKGKIISCVDSCGQRPAADLLIGEVELYERQKIKYLFDFGDEWVFDILVEKIDKEASLDSKPCITHEQGESPEQYPNDDWDWDEE